MKRFIRILLPILLAIAIVISIGWYLFSYDPEFTRDILMQQARYLEDSGNHSAAVWFYEMAYRQSKDNDHVAIELAQQYKSIGNYTKAESTLSRAIEDGGSIALYIALCQTFVEQNKLLDAVQMLEKVNVPTIKAQLDSLRPLAPEASYAPGEYTEYLDVSLASPSGTIYYSLDGEYPSLSEDSYTGPISLPRGQTTIFALCVGDNGLVSTPAVYTYEIDKVMEVVQFQDAAVEEAVRTQLGIPGNRDIYSKELWQITQFQLPAGAMSCQDLFWMRNLEQLTIEGNVIDSLQSLVNLDKLQTLTIRSSVLSSADLQRIAKLPALRILELSDCGLSSVEALQDAKNLMILNLSGNSLRDVSVLQALTQLSTLDLSHNALVNLNDIASLSNLMTLDVSYNSIVSTAPLSSLTKLTALYVEGNGLMSLEGMDRLTSLKQLSVKHNKLVDIQILEGCTELISLDVSNNTLLNIDVISHFAQLQTLDFSNNEVTSLPKLPSGSKLRVINGAYNDIRSIASLKGLDALTTVSFDHNKNLSSISALRDCSKLELVNVYGTKVRDVDFLTDRGVIVNYSPL